MSKKIKDSRGFNKVSVLLKKHRVSLAALLIFFIGFVATGLVYAAITGELKYFGTTVWVDAVNVDIVNATLSSNAGDDDYVEISPDAKTLTFYLKFDEINVPKIVNFCLRNNGSHTVQFNLPVVTNSTDPTVHVDWPNLNGLIIIPGETVCNSDTKITAYYTDVPIGPVYYSTMNMGISYDQI